MTALTISDEQQTPTYGLRVTRTDEGGDAVIRLAGDLELATAALVESEVERASATDCERIVFDLRGLRFLDSTGIRALLEARDRCRADGRSFALLLEPGGVRRTLEICGLLDMLDHDDTPEAIAA